MQGDGARLYDGDARPGKEEGRNASVGAPEIVVITARMGICRSQLRIAECSDKGDRPAGQPQEQDDAHTAALRSDDGRRFENACPDDHADDNSHAVEHGEGALRRRLDARSLSLGVFRHNQSDMSLG